MRYYTIAVTVTDLSGTEANGQVGVDIVVTSGSLDGIMVSTLARNVKHVGLIPI